MKRIFKPVVVLIAVMLGGLAVALLFHFTLTAKEPLPELNINVQSAPISRETKAATSFASVIKKAAPSVVNIFSTRVVRAQDNPFRRFYGDNLGPRGRRPRDYRAEGLGSGVIISADGYILTASHVVEGADDVKVALADGKKEISAKVIGFDPASDVALLKVDAKNLPAIILADSDKLEVGDMALAIGNPFGVGQTVTSGIISGLRRDGMGINGENGYENFIQTDAAVNPGNSGGALVDAEGRLIGINTAIFSLSGGNQGIGFAVPVNLAREMMERILKDGKVTHGYLGVNMQTLTPDLAKEFNVPVPDGVLIGGVMPGTPAEKAGIKELDVITEFGGKKITDSRQLRLAVMQTPAQTKVTLKIFRGGAAKTLTATLAEAADDSQMAKISNDSSSSNKIAGDALQGMTVTNLTSSLRRQFRVSGRVQGAIITAVDIDSPAADAGLSAGDVIIEINHQPVSTADETIEVGHKSTNGRVLLRVWSRDEDGSSNTRFTMIQTGKR
jgi:serine protease Do